MTTKLKLYEKAAVNLLQERPGTLADDTLVVRELNAVYEDAVKGCLEEGLWRWALRTVKSTYDASFDTSEFGGLPYCHILPDDFVRIGKIGSDPDFHHELMDYELTGPGKRLYTNSAEIYLQYVSNGPTYGFDLAQWPESFADAVGHRLAQRVALIVTKKDGDRTANEKDGDIQVAKAKVRSAVDDRVKTKPPGILTRSRFGGYRSRNSRQY